MPACENLFDVDPELTEFEPDPADAADWAAAIAALEGSCGDSCGYTLRVFEYEPGMAPTLLGDVMNTVTTTSPLGYQWPWLTREADDTLPVSGGIGALLLDVLEDLGLTGQSYNVAQAAEEVPCPNCHIFHDSFVLLFRDARRVVVLDVDTFWDG